jgi:hypothetical protein
MMKDDFIKSLTDAFDFEKWKNAYNQSLHNERDNYYNLSWIMANYIIIRKED